MRILLAVNHPQLMDQLVRETNLEITPASDICYREAVVGAVAEDRPDILILSAFLDGSVGFPDIVFKARESGARVIFLAGSLGEDDPIIPRIASLGVYDIIFNPISLKKILLHVESPAQFSDIAPLLKGRMPLDGSDKPSANGGYVRKGESSKKTGAVSRIKSAVTRSQGKERPAGDREDRGGREENLQEGKTQDVTGKDESQVDSSQPAQPNVSVEGEERQVKKNQQYYQQSLIGQRSRAGTKVGGEGEHETMNGDDVGNKTLNKTVTVACWSPAPAGKTFIAVNLAVTAAKNGANTGLLDMDLRDRAVYTWLNITTNPSSIYGVLSGEKPDPARFGELAVYGADPVAEPAEINKKITFDAVMQSILPHSFVVFDMPRELADWHWDILNSCNFVVVVADLDCNSYIKLSRFGGKLKSPLLVVNKSVKTRAPLAFEELFRAEPIARIPMTDKVFDSIFYGRPLVSTDNDIRKLFNAIYHRIKQRKEVS